MKKALFMLFALLPLLASAYDAQIDGIYYNFSGDKAAVTYQNSVDYNSYFGAIVIPASVTYNSKTYSVTSIGYRAFYDCSSLTSITIPNSVTSISDGAFRGCYFLEKNFINNTTLTSSNNWGATICDVEMPDGLLIVGSTVVRCRSWATSVTISEGLTSIGQDAFRGCSGLTSIAIPSSLTSIGSNAFYNCNALTAVHITDLAAWCNISFSDQPLSYAHHLYLNGQEINNLVIPNSVTSIGDYAFYNCSGLTSVIIPNGVTNIGGLAFSGCSGLTSITIPNSVTSIGDYAFRYCTGLTSVTIPNSVTSIGSQAFVGCELRNILIKCETPPYINSSFSNQTFYHATLYVPSGRWAAYAYNNTWYQFINLRETATAEEQVSMQQAYTLMDANTFAYSVYDPVNDCIGTISSVGINEDNPNHSWQVIEAEGNRYLYNMGAKKFVVASANGTYTLTDEPTSINMADGDNGIIIGTQTSKQWALVSDESLSVEQAIIDGINEIKDFNDLRDLKDFKDSWFTPDGKMLSKPQKGLNIIRNSDGAARKVLLK